MSRALPGLSSAHISPRPSAELASFDVWRDTIAHEWAHVEPRRWWAPTEPWDDARITYTPRANFMSFSNGRHWGRAGGGDRSGISTFSKQSRFRLLRLVNSIDRSAMGVHRVWFVTLTYPGTWANDPRVWKRHLDTWRKRLERQWGRLPAIWKLEPQRRGAPHFHLLIFTEADMTEGMQIDGMMMRRGRRVTRWRGGQISRFREWCSRSWYEVVGSQDEKHLRAGTSVEPLDNWQQASNYAGKYLGKQVVWCNYQTGEVPADDNGNPLPVGRFWGVWRRESLPIHEASPSIPAAAWPKIRRALHRIAKARGESMTPARTAALTSWPRSVSMFVDANTLERLLDCYARGWRNHPEFWARGRSAARESRAQGYELPTLFDLQESWWNEWKAMTHPN